MAKIIQFNANAGPEKFGLQRVHRGRGKDDKTSQLNLFAGGKVVRLNQQTFFEEALLLDEQGERESARQRYLKAISEGDCIADSYCNLGILESQEGRFPKAIDCFTLCLKHEPRHYEAHYNLANLYAEVGNLGLARLHYEIAIEIEPAFSNCFFNLGLTLAMNRDYAQAIEILTKYRELTPAEDHHQVDELVRKLAEMK